MSCVFIKENYLAKDITVFDDNIWNDAFGLLVCDRLNPKE